MFYISTEGHSASTWLAKSFNNHPNVVCWHGSRSIPPYDHNDLNYKDLTPEQFVNGLLSCEKNTYFKKVFGAAHGFHGIKLKNEIEKKGGKFFAIFRNPYAKINSIFSAYYPFKLTNGKIKSDGIKFDSLKIFKDLDDELNIEFKNYLNLKKKNNSLKEFLRKYNLLEASKLARNSYFNIQNYIKQKIASESNTSNNIENFSKKKKNETAFETLKNACMITFETDLKIIENCEFDNCFTMEEFVSSEDYFNEMFKKITNFEMNKEQLKIIFSDQNHVNYHSIKRTNEEIYECFPKGFKELINDYLKNEKLSQFYKKKGYDIF